MTTLHLYGGDNTRGQYWIGRSYGERLFTLATYADAVKALGRMAVPHHPCSSCGYPMRGGPMCGDCQEYGAPVLLSDFTRAWERVGNLPAYEAWKAER